MSNSALADTIFPIVAVLGRIGQSLDKAQSKLCQSLDKSQTMLGQSRGKGRTKLGKSSEKAWRKLGQRLDKGLKKLRQSSDKAWTKLGQSSDKSRTIAMPGPGPLPGTVLLGGRHFPFPGHSSTPPPSQASVDGNWQSRRVALTLGAATFGKCFVSPGLERL